MLHNFTTNPYLIQAKSTSFLVDEGNPGLPDFVLKPTPGDPNRYPVRILIIGIPDGVTSVIYELYLKEFAQTSEWSPAIKVGQPGEIMKVMTRYVVINS